MRIGIDASNLRSGGGITHLIELLKKVAPQEWNVTQVIVWSGQTTLDRIEDRPWLTKSHVLLLDKHLIYRMFWQYFLLTSAARRAECDILFVPGGAYLGSFHPVVTMSRNMLPFEWRELRRYGWSFLTLRLLFLRWTQTWAFRHADGLVFLTQYANKIVSQITKNRLGKIVIIPHGISSRFTNPPREQKPIQQFSDDNPYRIIYVSIVNVYKHQWHVVNAVAQLRQKGYPLALDLVGPAYWPALKRMKRVIHQVDPAGKYIYYHGPVAYEELPILYKQADLCLFASSCENMPNILLEGMASGLPIACSNKGPMPEVLGNAGVYFDPEDPNQIAGALKDLIESPALRIEKAKASFAISNSYSWAECAVKTFRFISEIGQRKNDPISWHDNNAERFARRYDASRAFQERFALWKKQLEINLFPGATVLDLGCGNGALSILAAPMAKKIIAIDGSDKMTYLAKQNIVARKLNNIHIIKGRLEDLPELVAEKVDIILCSSVLEYVDDPNILLKICKGAINPSGKLLISVPNGNSWYRILEKLAYRYIRKPDYYSCVKTMESPDKMVDRLELAGFRILDKKYFGSSPILPKSFNFIGLKSRSDTLVLFVAEPLTLNTFA